MQTPCTICVVDDDQTLNSLLCTLLGEQGYKTLSFASASEFLNQQNILNYDLIISDITMPGLSGYEFCKILRSHETKEYIPIILLTGKNLEEEKVTGITSGADDFIPKPFKTPELLAKIKSLLQIRINQKNTLNSLHTMEIEKESLTLKLVEEEKRSKQYGKLTRYFSPKVAELITSGNDQALLKRHRSEVSILFVDLRGFTSFSETSEPEEVLSVLEEYYRTVGTIALEHGGTLGHLAGDGIMVFFNDPVPIPNHQEVAVNMALKIREKLIFLKENWISRDFNLDFGIGLADGFATIGRIGFEQFWQYSVIGTVANLASRLCYTANHGQILVSQRFFGSLNTKFTGESIGTLELKGIHRPITLYNIISSFAKKAAS